MLEAPKPDDSANESIPEKDKATATKKAAKGKKSAATASPRKKAASKKKKAASKKKEATKKKAATKRGGKSPYPKAELQEAVKIALAIRHKNGGNPWSPDLIAPAVEYPKGNSFYYLTAASRDFGLTTGTANATEIALTDLGRRLAYAESPEEEQSTRRDAFMNVPLFRDVLDYYQGSKLPEMKYLQNTLENSFGLAPSVHEEFADLFRKNCEYIGITEGVPSGPSSDSKRSQKSAAAISVSTTADFVTVAEPEEDTGLLCFVAMPFSERHEEHPKGFFSEVLKQIIAPAGRKAGFRVVTARKQGSDVIHATIVNGLLDADLVVVDLTEHNPNVLFELGMRMNDDKPVALIRAEGTKPIFDVDNMLRVEQYSPCLWPSTVEVDMPRIASHIKGAWDNRNDEQSYMRILRNKRTSELPAKQTE